MRQPNYGRTRDGQAAVPLPLRQQVLATAEAELGVVEATGNNDGERVEQYLAYTGLGKGNAWCAAFVSWCYGQVGQGQPRNAWSPALFPKARTYWKQGKYIGAPKHGFAEADLFGIYSSSAGRINHVGLLKAVDGAYLLTVEGNSNDRVESRRRHSSTVYAMADWIGDME